MASVSVGNGRTRLSVVLAVVIAALVLVSTGAAILVQWHMLRQQTVELLRSRADTAMDQIEDILESILWGGQRALLGLEKLIQDDSLDPESEEIVGAVLEGALATHEQLSALVLVRSDLRQIAAIRIDDQTTVQVESIDGTEDGLQRFLDFLNSIEDFVWRYPDDHTYYNARSLHVIHPVRYGDGEKVFLVAGVTLDGLSTHLDDETDSDVVAFAIRGKDHVIAYPTFESVDDEPVEGERIEQLGDPVLLHMADSPPLPGFENHPDDVTVRRVDVGRDSYIVSDKRIHKFGSIPWTIGAYAPLSELDPFVRPLRLAYAAGGATLLIAILLAIVVGRQIARPIKRNTDRTALVSELELEKVPLLPPSRIVEFNNQASAFNNMMTSLRAFETYVPKALVRRILESGEDVLASEERELSIMFTDIVGFTTISETLAPRDLSILLNDIFTIQGRIIEDEHGTIDKYMGDGLMAFWGAPERLRERREQSCRAALRIRAAFHEFNADRGPTGKPFIKLRIGIHYGMTVVGNIGSKDRVNYTVVGDSVNVAQRLEQQARTLDDDPYVVIAVSESVAKGVEPDSGYSFAEFGSVTVKGRQAPLTMLSLSEAQASRTRA